jgi:ABC-type sugar transport system permease subunit
MARIGDQSLPGGISRSGTRTAARSRTLWQEIVRARLAYLLLLPMFLTLAIFVYYPPLSALYHAFFAWDPTQPSSPLVGLDNFKLVFQDPHMWQATTNMAQLLVFGVTVGTVVPLIVAELIYAVRDQAARYAYRVLFLIPVIVPMVVTILMWKFFYDANLGVLNAVLDGIGLGGLKHDWLGSFGTALYAVMFVGFPFISGTSVLIYLAGLMNIPGEVMEAAALDGATGLQRIRRIDLPLLLGQIRLFVVLGIIYGVQQFQIQLIMTGNPPGGPGWATTVPALEMYNEAFESNRYGYASAIGFLLFLVVLVLSIITFRFMRSSATEGA